MRGVRKIKRMIDIGFTVCKRAGIPFYWSKYSKKSYTIHQHLLIVVLSEYFGMSIERTLEMIREDRYIRSLLKLRSVPHKSTISRFKKRVKEGWFALLFRKINDMLGKGRGRCAVDSTGLRISKRSFYYTKRIGKEIKIRECLKLHVVMDIDTRIILSANVTRFRVNDSKMFIPLLENVEKIREVYADRGYDSKRNIEYVLGRGGAPYIAVRKNAVRGVRKRILKEMDKKEWKKKYGMRNRIESAFHAIKTRYGEYVFARTFVTGKIQSLFKILAYNIHIFPLSFLILPFSCFSGNSTYPLTHSV